VDSILAYMAHFDYENLYFCQEKETGLRAIIALHDTTLGPATGGCRMWTYATVMAWRWNVPSRYGAFNYI
jgi:glutamate dehydrogenase/leucine dehydrogenase